VRHDLSILGGGGSREGLTAPVGKASHVLKLENRPRHDIGFLCYKKKEKNKKKKRNGEKRKKFRRRRKRRMIRRKKEEGRKRKGREERGE